MLLMWRPIWVKKFYLDMLEYVWLQESEYSTPNGLNNGVLFSPMRDLEVSYPRVYLMAQVFHQRTQISILRNYHFQYIYLAFGLFHYGHEMSSLLTLETIVSWVEKAEWLLRRQNSSACPSKWEQNYGKISCFHILQATHSLQENYLPWSVHFTSLCN